MQAYHQNRIQGSQSHMTDQRDESTEPRAAGLDAPAAQPGTPDLSRRALLRRVDTISRRAPRHAQPQLAPLMRAARSAAAATLSAGAERVLDELARSPMTDEAWLHAVGEFAALHARGRGDAAPRLLALLLLRPA